MPGFFGFDQNFPGPYTNRIGCKDPGDFTVGSLLMRMTAVFCFPCLCLSAFGAELESRVLTHYVPQDFLETVVRREGWTELTLNVKGGVRKGDVVRIWAGGSIDW